MSPCCGSLCLLVLLGAAMAFGSPVLSEEHMDNLLGLEEVEVGSKPLFSSVIRNINNVCQTDMQLVNATLDFYMRIFSSILQHDHQRHHGQASGLALLNSLSSSDKTYVSSVLRERQRKIEELRGTLGKLNHDNEKMIHQLNNLKVDVPTEQRKALAEFNRMYKALSHCNSSVH